MSSVATKVGVHIVIASSVHRLDMYQFSTPEGIRYGMVAKEYEYFESLAKEAEARAGGEESPTVLMDFDADNVHSPFFESEAQAFEWGLANFPHLSKIDVVGEKENPIDTLLVSRSETNRLWLEFAAGNRNHPKGDKPQWVDSLRAANAEAESGRFLHR